ncbi:MAG: trigger factor [Bacillota bacterium]
MAGLEVLEKSRVKLTIEIPADVFAEAIQKAYLKEAKHYNVPGFRKGKAPRKVIQNMYGEGVFYESAFELVYPDAYEAAVKEHDLEPVDRPDIEILELGPNQNVVFSAAVPVQPEVALGAYKGIEVAVGEYNVTDAMVDAQIEREREKLVRYVEVERPIAQGDRVVLDYSGSVDGVQFPGGTAENQSLDIGSGMFIPGFEDQLVGMSTGESADISVKFPDEYHAEELKGKDAVFAVTIRAVQVKELPALDDEFAKDVSEFDTLEAFKASKRKELEENAENAKKTQTENEAIRVASANATIDIPDAMIERQITHMLKEISYRLASQGLKFEDYLKYTGQDMESIRAQYREEAEARVRTQLTLDAIAKAEEIKPDPAAVDKSMEDYAKQIGQDAEEFRKQLAEDEVSYFEDQNVMEQTVALIVENAVIVKKAGAEQKES